MEDKQAVVSRLEHTLHATRAGRDIAEMRYERLVNGEEIVDIVYAAGGITHVNVTGDSGLAMIVDITEALK